MGLHSKICGYYKIEKVMNAGTALEYKVPLVDWFPNLITNNGLDYFLDGWMNGFCRVGSGNDVPVVGDLALESQLGYTQTKQSTTTGNSSSPLYYKWGRNVFRFAAGTATGNISELGVGWHHENSGTLFSRALVLDGGGNPTTITKLADETLDVTYELRLYPNLTDFTGSFTLTGDKGASYTYTGRPAYVGNAMTESTGLFYGMYYPGVSITGYTSTLGAYTSVPTGAYLSLGNTTKGTYTPGSYKIGASLTVGLTDGNHASGIKSIHIRSNQVQWQLELNNPIMKTSSDILTLEFELSWGRI